MKCFSVNIGPNKAELTCYIHSESRELSNATKRPAVLVFPGGGYAACGDREAEPVALAYMAEGFNAFVLRYSVGPNATFDQAFADAECAVKTIRQNEAEWGIMPDRVSVAGFSAGGHLAAALGTMGIERPNAMVLGYPCIFGTLYLKNFLFWMALP